LLVSGNAFTQVRTAAWARHRVISEANIFSSFRNSLEKIVPGNLAGERALAKLAENVIKAVDVAKFEGTDAADDAVLEALENIELAFPTKLDLLSDTSSTGILDGEWDLIYTVAAFGSAGSEGKQDAGKRGVRGAVNATGFAVDTTGEGVRTTQTFDVAAGRVANDIFRPLRSPFGTYETRLQVSGPFSQSPASGRRADVLFDKLELEVAGAKITIGWLFDLIYAIRKDEKAESWLETTHLSDTLRIGRGNKGSVFVLTRPALK
jgi:hypothetical protein